jgi:RNA binding exosome subunit
VPHLSSSKYPIAYITITVFSHATEDPEKVQTAIRNTLPEAIATEVKFTKNEVTGHHGNPIIFYEAKLTDKPALPAALEKIAQDLSSLDKETLSEEIKQHIEKHNLYLRFDKQNAYLGTLKLATNDPIRFKIHFKNKTPQQIMELCQKAGLLP